MKLDELVVLLAEDDEDEVMLFERALNKVINIHRLITVRDGQEALDYLGAKGVYADRVRYPFPNVLLLDLKMPRVDGIDVLRWLKDHPDCGVIPTIIFSNSDQPGDIKAAYANRANAYFRKPTGYEELVEVLQAIFGYWCRAEVPLPPPDAACR